MLTNVSSPGIFNASKPFDWNAYMKSTGAIAAPESAFQKKPFVNQFEPKMKLEAVDIMDPRLICCATVER